MLASIERSGSVVEKSEDHLRRVALLVCGAAALVHLVIGLWMSPEWLFSKYPDAIRLLREGRLTDSESADYSPLYFILNRIFSPGPLRWLQSVVGALAVWGTSEIARRVSGNVAAMVSAWLLALCSPMLAYEATIEPDLLIAGLEVGALLALSGAQLRRRNLLVAGGALGLAAALRPSGLILLVMAAVALVLGRKDPVRRRLLSGALLFGVGALVGGGIILGLRVSHGGETRATMSVGAVLHMGNRPEGTGFGANPPHLIKLIEAQERSFSRPDSAHELYRVFARYAESQADLGSGASEDYWVSRTFAFVREEPRAYLRLQGRKLQAYLVGPFAHDISIVRDLSNRMAAGPAAIPVQLLDVLGLTGLLWVVLRPGRKRAFIPLVFFFSHLALSVIFYVVARYQLPVLPLLAVWAGTLFAELPRAIHRRQDGWMIPVGASAAILLVWALWSADATSRSMILVRGREGGASAREFYNARGEGDAERATQAFIDAQGAQPYLRNMADWRGVDLADDGLLRASLSMSIERFGLERPIDALLTAQLLVMAGDCVHALPLLEELDIAWAIYDRSIDPDLLAAECLRRLGRQDEAAERIEASLKRRPGAIDALAQRYASAVAIGDPVRAASAHELLQRLHDPLSAGYVLADALLAWSQPERALEAAERVLDALPDAAVVHHQRALSLVALGRHREALMAFDKASILFPAHPFDVQPLGVAVEEVVREDPGNPAILSVAAEYALRRGDWSTARRRLERATTLYGEETPAAHRQRLKNMGSLTRRP